MKHDVVVGAASTVIAAITVPESFMSGAGRLMAALGTAALAAVVSNLVNRLLNSRFPKTEKKT